VVFSGSSTNKTDRHDITEILLKAALDTINQTKCKGDKPPIPQKYTTVLVQYEEKNY
jgi:hypothetical protein